MKVCLPSGIYFYLLKNVQNIFEINDKTHIRGKENKI